MKSKAQIIEAMNNSGPELIRMLGGKMVDLDIEKAKCTFEFTIGKQFCHSIDIVQGGFVCAMLDVAMSHSVFSQDPDIVGVSSLEIKTSYLEATRAGKLRVEGWIMKLSHKTAFLEGHIYNEENVLTATASSVSKVIRLKK